MSFWRGGSPLYLCHLLWHPGFGTLAVESCLWNLGCGILIVESWLWKHCWGITFSRGTDILQIAPDPRTKSPRYSRGQGKIPSSPRKIFLWNMQLFIWAKLWHVGSRLYRGSSYEADSSNARRDPNIGWRPVDRLRKLSPNASPRRPRWESAVFDREVCTWLSMNLASY